MLCYLVMFVRLDVILLLLRFLDKVTTQLSMWWYFTKFIHTSFLLSITTVKEWLRSPIEHGSHENSIRWTAGSSILEAIRSCRCIQRIFDRYIQVANKCLYSWTLRRFEWNSCDCHFTSSSCISTIIKFVWFFWTSCSRRYNAALFAWRQLYYLSVLMELRLVTDRRADTGRLHMPSLSRRVAR